MMKLLSCKLIQGTVTHEPAAQEATAQGDIPQRINIQGTVTQKPSLCVAAPCVGKVVSVLRILIRPGLVPDPLGDKLIAVVSVIE